jgi:hypothetical protein
MNIYKYRSSTYNQIHIHKHKNIHIHVYIHTYIYTYIETYETGEQQEKRIYIQVYKAMPHASLEHAPRPYAERLGWVVDISGHHITCISDLRRR